MARNLTRQERIEYLIHENITANKSMLEQSRGYCEAFVDGEIACENAENAMKNWSYNKLSIEARQKREEFRAKLADLGRSEETLFSSKVLEAYDKVHCPELREKELFKEETPEAGIIRLSKIQGIYELWYHGRKIWVSKS